MTATGERSEKDFKVSKTIYSGNCYQCGCPWFWKRENSLGVYWCKKCNDHYRHLQALQRYPGRKAEQHRAWNARNPEKCRAHAERATQKRHKRREATHRGVCVVCKKESFLKTKYCCSDCDRDQEDRHPSGHKMGIRDLQVKINLAEFERALFNRVRECLPTSFNIAMEILQLRVRAHSPAAFYSELPGIAHIIGRLYGPKRWRIKTATNDPLLWDWALIIAAMLHVELMRKVNLKLGKSMPGKPTKGKLINNEQRQRDREYGRIDRLLRNAD